MIWLLLACIETGLDGKDPDAEGVQGELAVSPDTLDFGQAAYGTEGSKLFTLSSIGEGPVDIERINLVAPSTYSLSHDDVDSLSPGEELEVLVSYQAFGLDEAGQVFIENDGFEPLLAVDVWGEAILPALQISPSSVSMTSLQGEEVSETVRLLSVGNDTLVVDAMVTVGDDSFVFDAPVFPQSLEPGEYVEFDVSWSPTNYDVETAEAWFTDNTIVGSAMVPIDARQEPPCMGLAEAWETANLDASISGSWEDSGNFILENVSPDTDICIDQWTVWMTEASQDLGAGDHYFDPGGTYPLGSITLEPGDSVSFEYGGTDAYAWYCIEEFQYTIAGGGFTFIGARVPPVILNLMLAYDQDAVWEHIATEPVFIVGRDTNVVNAGDTVNVIALNLGRGAGVVRFAETVPNGYDASNFSQQPVDVEYTTDGITYWFETFLPGAIDTDTDRHTQYSSIEVSFTLENDGAACTARSYGFEPLAEWEDSDGTQYSTGSPLLILCEEE